MADNSTVSFKPLGILNDPQFQIVAGVLDNQINGVPVLTIEFACRDKKLDLNTLVGADMGLVISDSKEPTKKQPIWGTCVSAEYKGTIEHDAHFFLEISPWLWFLTRASNNRIFQEMTATEIVKKVLGDAGFGGNIIVKHSSNDPTRDYAVQYRETDLAFMQRMLEDIGVYFYFEFTDNAADLILADDPNAHAPLAGDASMRFVEANWTMGENQISSWELVQRAVTGKVTLDDYDFTKPDANLTVKAEITSGSGSHTGYENYRYPGGYKNATDGKKIATNHIEAAAMAHATWQGRSNAPHITVARSFTLMDHPRVGGETFMVIKSRFMFRMATGKDVMARSYLQRVVDFGMDEFQLTACTFEAVDISLPFRLPAITPKPVMTGVQTAVVTGPSGEEIYTDEYGRIKVQFHWDRDGSKDDKTSCWVRTMMPWTGANWGMINIPRIGNEVVIQFEEGDPDKPICVGMLYNAKNMPPYPLNANATRSGIKTNSTKGGDGYNELMFEDKKGDELVRFFAEKDYVQNVENSAHIKVGYDHPKDVTSANAQDARSMKLEVENHLDEIVETGDHSFEVKAGKQTIKVKKDKTETIDGASTLKVFGDVKETVTSGNVTQEVKQGNVTQNIKMGNISREVSMGNDETVVKLGNYSIDTSLGKVDITAMQSITLKVGPSEIKVDMSGVTIKGPMVKVEGMAMAEVKAPMTQVKGDAMVIIKGGLTMIN